MARNIYLIVFNSPLFPAHWGLWIPQDGSDKLGKLIHATGDAAVGFQVTFERNYDITTTTRRYQLVPLTQVGDSRVVDDEPSAGRRTEKYPADIQQANDSVEYAAMSVPAPGPSLRSSSSLSQGRAEIRNCQTWLAELVQLLVDQGIMDESAIAIVNTAPKN